MSATDYVWIPKGTKIPTHIDPAKLTVIKDPKHFLFDRRAFLPFDEDTVLGMVWLEEIFESVDVTQIWNDKKSHYCLALIDGRQRRTNAIEANRIRAEQDPPLPPLTLEVKIIKGTPLELTRRMVVKNEHRKESDYVTRGYHAKTMFDAGDTMEQVCVAFKVVPQTIKNWLALTKLTAKVQDMVVDGKLSPTAAQKLAKYKKSEQLEKAQKLLSGTGDRSGPGTKHVGVDKRRVKTILEKEAVKEDVSDDVKLVLGWYAGTVSDRKVGHLIDFGKLKKKAKKKAKKAAKKKPAKKKAAKKKPAKKKSTKKRASKKKAASKPQVF